MAYRPPLPIAVPLTATTTTGPLPSPTPASALAAEARTLLTFPTEGLPSPRVLSQADLRAFPVRYPTGSAPTQTRTNRWLCCRCAEEGYLDPVGMVHCSSSPSPAAAVPPVSHHNSNDTIPWTGGGEGTSESSSEDGGYGICWRPSCRHRKCINCALYAGPLGKDPKARLLIRTVGGLYASPKFVDPVYWECKCGEWARNRFDSRSTLGVTGCRNEGCVFAWRAGSAQLGLAPGFVPEMAPRQGIDGERSDEEVAGVLAAQSMVMNRYGERLGTADQRTAVAQGPWDVQRRALGDPKCVIVAGLRAAMKRAEEGMQFDRTINRSRRSMDLGSLWNDGDLVPHYPYRRPPPVDENDVEENNEYEGSYLTGIRSEPLDKGKGPEYAPSPMTHSPAGFFLGWNHLQM